MTAWQSVRSEEALHFPAEQQRRDVVREAGAEPRLPANWGAGELLVRGKGGLHDRMPLPVDVGEAIVAYLRDGRVGRSRHLFVRPLAPHQPLSTQAIRLVLRKAFARTGLKPPEGGIRIHLLRHSLAIDMLGRGASLDEIGEVLRHRSYRTTTNYARYDIEALRSVARPWPVPEAPR